MDSEQKFQNLYNKLLEIVKCPIQQSIMNDVVMAEDGHFYEKSALKKWLNEKNISPITNQRIDKEVMIPTHSIKALIDLLFEYNPALKEEQFLPEKSDHASCSTEIHKHLNNGNYHALLKYQKFSLEKFVGPNGQYDDTFINFLINVPVNVLTYVFDNMDNLETIVFDKSKLVHYACISGRLELVKYLVEKKVSFEDRNTHFKKPIHYAAESCNFDTIKYIMDNLNVKLDDKDKKKNYPIHYLLNNNKIKSNKKIILLEKFTNLNYPNGVGLYPIHIACAKDDIQLVKYLIGRKINLEVEDSEGFRPIHYVCTKPELISCLIPLIEQGVELNCETNSGKNQFIF